MNKFIRRKVINSEHRLAKNIQSIALYSNSIAFITEGELLQVITNIQTKSPEVTSSHHLGWRPSDLLLSPSLRFVLLWDNEQRQIVVWDLFNDCIHAKFGTQKANPKSAVATILMLEDDEVLLISHGTEPELEAYYLKNMNIAFRAECRKPFPFFFNYLPIFPTNDIFFGIGCGLHEMMDTLISISFQRLMTDGHSVEYELMHREGIYDHAYRLAAGPCGVDHIIVFRDPNGYEDEDEEEKGELWNFRGLYIRRISDCKLIERIEYDANIQTGASLFATNSAVAIICPDHIEILPRSGVEMGAISFYGKAFGIDPEHNCIARVTEKGEIELIEILSYLKSN